MVACVHNANVVVVAFVSSLVRLLRIFPNEQFRLYYIRTLIVRCELARVCDIVIVILTRNRNENVPNVRICISVVFHVHEKDLGLYKGIV